MAAVLQQEPEPAAEAPPQGVAAAEDDDDTPMSAAGGFTVEPRTQSVKWTMPTNLPSHKEPVRFNTPANQKHLAMGFIQPLAMDFIARGGKGPSPEDMQREGGLGDREVDARWGFVPLGARAKKGPAKKADHRTANGLCNVAAQNAHKFVAFGQIDAREWIIWPPAKDEASGRRRLQALWARMDLDRKRSLENFKAKVDRLEENKKEHRKKIAQRWEPKLEEAAAAVAGSSS